MAITILTALRDEYLALVKALEETGHRLSSSKSVQGLPVQTTEIETRGGVCKLSLLHASDMGASSAAAVAMAAVKEFRPSTLVMIGICAGNPNSTNPGDVVVAERLFHADAGKRVEGQHYQDIKTYNLKPSWKSRAEAIGEEWAANYLERPALVLSQLAWLLDALVDGEVPVTRLTQHLDRSRKCPDWPQVLRIAESEKLVSLRGDLISATPEGIAHTSRRRAFNPDGEVAPPIVVHVKPVATVSEVIVEKEIWARFQREGERNVMGLDMEGAALGVVSELAGVNLLFVKGVQDHADSRKLDTHRPYAARAAASLTIELLRQLDEPSPGAAAPVSESVIRDASGPPWLSRMVTRPVRRFVDEVRHSLSPSDLEEVEGRIERLLHPDTLERLEQIELALLLAVSVELTYPQRTRQTPPSDMVASLELCRGDASPDDIAVTLLSEKVNARLGFIHAAARLVALLCRPSEVALELGVTGKSFVLTSGVDAQSKTLLLEGETESIDAFAWALGVVDLANSLIRTCEARFHPSGAAVLRVNRSASRVECPFEPIAPRIAVDADAAVKTLTGRALYADESVFARELIQNALDACRSRIAKDGASYRGAITIEFDSIERTLTVRDNGIGMTCDDAIRNLLTACTPGFREQEGVADLISRFGIGFLSVFVVSSNVTVLTRHWQSDGGHRLELRSTSDPVAVYRVPDAAIGTSVTVRLEPVAEVDARMIERWCAVAVKTIDVSFSIDGVVRPSRPRSMGQAVAPLTYAEHVVEEADTELGVRVIVRGTHLLRGEQPVSMCGLSFQRSLDARRRYVPEDAMRLVAGPSVASRVFCGGVPMLGSDENLPEYNAHLGRPTSLLHSFFGPFELHIDRPTEFDVNVARSAFLDTPRNAASFTRVDSLLCRALVRSIRELGKGLSNQWFTRGVAEYWLANAGPPHSMTGLVPPLATLEQRELLSELFDQVEVESWDGYRYRRTHFGEVRGSCEIVVPLRGELFKTNDDLRGQFKRLFDGLGKPWKAITRVFGGSRLELHEVPSVSAARVVTVDPTIVQVEHPLLFAFLMRDATATALRVPPPPDVARRRTVWLTHVINCSDYLFVPFSAHYSAIGATAGSPASALLLNTSFKGLAPGDAEGIQQAIWNSGEGLVVAPGGSFVDAKAAMERAEIDPKFILERLIHPQAFKRFPIVVHT